MQSWIILQVSLLVIIDGNAIQLDQQWVKGIYSSKKHVTDGHKIVVPRKVTHNGDLISYDVTHHHVDDKTELHYRLEMAGSQYHFQLTPSKDFIGPGMVVERRKPTIHVRHKPSEHASKCHYRGFIRGHRNSFVALSACNGLTGVLRGEHGEFWLEPVEYAPKKGNGPSTEKGVDSERYAYASNASVASGRSHLVFRRSAAVDAGARKRSRRTMEKKKKYQRNCGTRNPRMLTETSLEWQTQPGILQVQGRGRRKNGWYDGWQRVKRSISRPRHVEALVVADTSMMAFHQDGDVETYLLTIMNMVSALYHHPTIGNFINVVVVRIILMEEEDAKQGLNITVNADKTLYNFCKWQLKLNPTDDSHPNHHDVAILVTRKDICSRANTPCSTLGVAHVAGMCQPDKSCSVNEDNGITLAHTITHELGHNFGMYHDTEKIGCSKRDGDTLHVMTPSFEMDTVGVAWSRCSQRDIINFLDQGNGRCLEDEPVDNDYAYPDLPPGAMYNAEHQCHLQFGTREASVCSPLQEICSKLWCMVDDTCSTLLHPAASGTHCGKHMWCQNQKCVPIVDRPGQIDGGWGKWGNWTECSRSCGAGVSIMERRCDHPRPAHGGKFCIGERRRYKVCMVSEPCSEGTASFRAVQCSQYDDKEYKGKNYTWLPYFDENEPCKLYCTNTNESVIVPLGEAALDGTPCNVGTRDICIGRICRKVGCDWRVDSNATEDRCGICYGDGTQCEITSGIYYKNEGLGYHEVVIIPVGARNIKIEELGNSENYIGIGLRNSDKYFLNGKRQITLAGEYEVAGTLALYKRNHEKGNVRIPGPIKEDIVVYLIHRGDNLGLHYEYTVPKSKPDRIPEYFWVLSDWSLCTATCGGGTQKSYGICRERKLGIVEARFCDEKTKPEFVLRECNKNSCPARWWVGPWQMCPVICGKGVRKRSVMCVSSAKDPDGSELALLDRDCDINAKPAEVGPCIELSPCPVTSKIPSIIYTDNKAAAVYNISTYGQYNLIISDGNSTEKPKILEFDNVVDENLNNSVYTTKPKWVVSKWSHCLYGKRIRQVTCSSLGDCDFKNKPVTSEECRGEKWVTGKWGACNATCAYKSGVKKREVICKDRATNKVSGSCILHRRPLDTRRCFYRRQCGNEKTGCKNVIRPASLCISYQRMCDLSSIVREKCCATCFKRRRHVRHNRRHNFGD